MPTRRRTSVTSMPRRDPVTVEQKLAFDAGVAERLVHAIHGSQKSGFAATGRSDESRYLIGGNIEADVVKRLETAVVKVDIPGAKLDSDGLPLLTLDAGGGRARCGIQYGLRLQEKLPQIISWRTLVLWQ